MTPLGLGLGLGLGRQGGGVGAPPEAPVAGAATSVLDTSFTANWAESAGATSYRLDVSTVSNFSSFVSGYEDKTVSGTSAAVTGLPPSGRTYYYRLRAVNAAGTSGNSNSETSTLLYPIRTDVTFFVNPKEHWNFYYSADLKTFTRCTNDDGTILSAVVNKIVCPITGKALITDVATLALNLVKDGNGNFYLNFNSSTRWKYILDSGNLYDAIGAQIIGVGKFNGNCTVHDPGATIITNGAFCGRSSGYVFGFWARAAFTSTQAECQKVLVRSVNCGVNKLNSYVYYNTTDKGIATPNEAVDVINCNVFGQAYSVNTWGNGTFYGHILYPHTTAANKESVGYARHLAMLNYNGGIGGGIVEAL